MWYICVVFIKSTQFQKARVTPRFHLPTAITYRIGISYDKAMLITLYIQNSSNAVVHKEIPHIPYHDASSLSFIQCIPKLA